MTIFQFLTCVYLISCAKKKTQFYIVYSKTEDGFDIRFLNVISEMNLVSQFY